MSHISLMKKFIWPLVCRSRIQFSLFQLSSKKGQFSFVFFFFQIACNKDVLVVAIFSRNIFFFFEDIISSIRPHNSLSFHICRDAHPIIARAPQLQFQSPAAPSALPTDLQDQEDIALPRSNLPHQWQQSSPLL